MTLPLGPYHPALPQPLVLPLHLRGETIVAVDPPVAGFCRRGIEDLAGGKPLDDALSIVERACAHAHESYRLAVCQAVESVAGPDISSSARLIRSLFVEVERILARFWTLGMVARAANYPAPFQDAMERREILFEALETVTGERVFWAVTLHGGVRPDLHLAPLRDALAALEPSVAAWRTLVSPKGALGRALKGSGQVSAERATLLGLTGLAARGSCNVPDLRHDAPYAGYSAVTLPPATSSNVAGTPMGDVASRLDAAVADIGASLAFALACADALDEDEHTSATAAAPSHPEAAHRGSAKGEARSTVEGPHGPITAVIELAPGDEIARIRLATPGAAILAALPELLLGQALAQALVVLNSLDLCVECLDL